MKARRPATDALPLAVLLASAFIVAAVTFTISAHGLFDFGQRVMGLPDELAWCVPAALDGAQLVAIAAAFMTRDVKRFQTTAYMWTVVSLTVGLSMAGNAWDARVRNLTEAGVIATSVAPMLLALTAHVMVMVWRRPEYLAAQQQRGPAKTLHPLSARQPAKRESKRGSGITADQLAQIRALKAQGVPKEQIGEQVVPAVSKRTVYRYTGEANGSAEHDLEEATS